MQRWWLLGAVFFVLSTPYGCVFQTPTPTFPSVRTLTPAQVATATVRVVSAGRDSVSGQPLVMTADGRATVEKAVRHLLERGVRGRSVSSDPARIRVDVTLGDGWDIADAGINDGMGFLMAGMVSPLGFWIEQQAVTVDVTVRSRGHTFSGRGHGERGGSIYARATTRALSDALSEALEQAYAYGEHSSR